MTSPRHILSGVIAASAASLALAHPALAHPGHFGIIAGGGLHHLTSPGHLLPAVLAGSIAGVLMVRSRRTWLRPRLDR